MPDSRSARGQLDDWSFLRRVAIVAAVVVCLFVAWKISAVLILLFGALLIATLIRGAAKQIERLPLVSAPWALAIVIGGIALAVTTLVLVVGSEIAGQLSEIFRQIPRALDAAGAEFGIDDASNRLGSLLSSEYSGQAFSSMAGFSYTVFGGVADLIIVLIAAVYIAADPATYRVGFAELFPAEDREAVLDTLSAVGHTLRQWFVGQLVSMLAVGIISGIVYWWLGLPFPIGLGIIAGVTNFVPLIGPLVGAIPALLFAFLVSPLTVLWVAAVVLVIQQVEGNLIMPLIQKSAINLPPAITLISILVFGSLFGGLGVVFAAPLAVVFSVLVTELWIGKVLEQQ